MTKWYICLCHRSGNCGVSKMERTCLLNLHNNPRTFLFSPTQSGMEQKVFVERIRCELSQCTNKPCMLCKCTQICDADFSSNFSFKNSIPAKTNLSVNSLALGKISIVVNRNASEICTKGRTKAGVWPQHQNTVEEPCHEYEYPELQVFLQGRLGCQADSFSLALNNAAFYSLLVVFVPVLCLYDVRVLELARTASVRSQNASASAEKSQIEGRECQLET